MFRREKLIKRIKELLADPVTLSEQRKLERMLDAALADVNKPKVVCDKDMQIGCSILNDDLLKFQLNKR